MLQTPPKFHLKTPREKKNENGGGEREKKSAKCCPLPPSLPPHFSGPHPWGPHPWGPHPLGAHLLAAPFGTRVHVICPICHFLSCPNDVFLSRVSLFILSHMLFFCPVCVFFVPMHLFILSRQPFASFVPTTVFLVPWRFFCPIAVDSCGMFFFLTTDC